MTSRVASGPMVHWWKSGEASPKLIPPRQTFEILMPERPGVVYYMRFSLWVGYSV